jgi:hypothetical protein
MTASPSAAASPFTTRTLLADPLARLAWADWLEEQGKSADAGPWRDLAGLHLTDWTVEHLQGRLKEANAVTERRSPRQTGLARRLTLMDCLRVANEAQSDLQTPGCCCVHGGGVCFGWRRGYTTVCLAVRRANGLVAVDVGAARARTTGGSPANVWPELVQFRPDTAACQARLIVWADQR